MKPGRVRLKDIAERTGFSVNTVSVALRGGSKVPHATRKVILAAAEELNYLPNALARSLARKRSRTVGVILSNLVNPIQTLCARLIERRLEERGYHMMLVSSDGSVEREKAAIDSLREHQVEGVLVYPANQQQLDHVAALRSAGFPVVVLSGVSNGLVDLVAIDERAGMYKLTTHLLELGHRRIGLIDAGQASGSMRKLAGYREALEARGVPFDSGLVICPVDKNTPTCGYRAASQILEGSSGPTAVIGSSDSVSIGVMRWCRDHEMAVPGSISIAGFDDIETAAFLDVPLTTVGYSTSGISEHSVVRVLSLIEAEEELAEPISLLIEPNLIVRSSTKPPQGGVAN